MRRKPSMYFSTTAFRRDRSELRSPLGIGGSGPLLGWLFDLANLAGDRPVLAVKAGESLGPLDRLLLGLRLDDRVTADDFLGLGERAVHHGELAAVPVQLGGVLGWAETGGVEQDTGLGH